jgi:formate hydrogenlyase subunit 6/NADH:ubiquinone oxidoreductase subunit I
MQKINKEADMDVKLIPVFFYGKRYDVPDSLTIMQAYEFAGHQYTRGCGCKGGACGACASIFLVPGDPALHVGLACQTQVASGMSIIQIPFFPYNKSIYELDDLPCDPISISRIYPEMHNCMGCNTCTKVCPQDIRVMECMSAAIRGNIESVAIQAISCVMCGMCAARCPAEIAPYNIMLLCKRLYGKYMQKPYRNLPSRLQEIESGQFNARLDELMEAKVDQLKDEYKKQWADRKII